MAKLPARVLQPRFIEMMEGCQGLKLTNRGKVRDIFDIPSHPHLMLIAASDRISIFDFVLPALVSYKGEVLTALTFFWLTGLLKDFPNHFEYSKKYPKLNAIFDFDFGDFLYRRLAKAGMVVRRVRVMEFELVFRRHLGGSVFAKYQETGKVAGIDYPVGLPKWSYLERSAFTPAKKSADGHDENIDVDEFVRIADADGVRNCLIAEKAYDRAYRFASERGIRILDTKFEVSDGGILADEIITPDSSRFTTSPSFTDAMARGTDPVFYDKEPVRIWGRTVETPFMKDGKYIKGLNNLNPENDEHINFVNRLVIPKGVIDETAKRYLEIFKMITGYHLLKYQVAFMAPKGFFS